MKPILNKQVPIRVKPSELSAKIAAAAKRADAAAKVAKAEKLRFKQARKKFKLAKKAAKAARRETKELKILLVAARSAATRLKAAKKRKRTPVRPTRLKSSAAPVAIVEPLSTAVSATSEAVAPADSTPPAV
jgi:DNA gyrase/topoisomerase IV subunit B